MGDERDFYDAMKALGPCKDSTKQTLDGICKVCRTAVTKLVLLRDDYRLRPEYYQ